MSHAIGWLFGIGAMGELACDVVVGGQNFRHTFSQGRDVYRVGTDIIEPAASSGTSAIPYMKERRIGKKAKQTAI